MQVWAGYMFNAFLFLLVYFLLFNFAFHSIYFFITFQFFLVPTLAFGKFSGQDQTTWAQLTYSLDVYALKCIICQFYIPSIE